MEEVAIAKRFKKPKYSMVDDAIWSTKENIKISRRIGLLLASLSFSITTLFSCFFFYQKTSSKLDAMFDTRNPEEEPSLFFSLAHARFLSRLSQSTDWEERKLKKGFSRKRRNELHRDSSCAFFGRRQQEDVLLQIEKG